MWDLFDQGLDDVARRETSWDQTTGKVERGLGEKVGDWIRGYSTEDISKKRQEQETKARKTKGPGRTLIRMAKDNPKRDLGIEIEGIDWSATPDDLDSQLAQAKKVKSAQDLLLYNDPTSTFLSSPNATNVPVLLAEVKKAEADAKRNTPEAIKDRERTETKWQWASEDRATRESDKLQLRRDNLDQRKDEYMLRLDELDIRRQSESNKMDIYRQQLANQRADKKSERMMALISGLATLGSGFAL